LQQIQHFPHLHEKFRFRGKNNFDNPIILDDIYIENENTKHLIYEINTYEMLNYIYEYMNLWKDDIKDICYIKEEQIQIHNPALILVEKDYLFIKKYIDDNINNIITKQKIYDKFNINEFNIIKQSKTLQWTY
jgi:hypothetical protein